MNNWIAALSKCVFKCWDRTAPGVCLPAKAPFSPSILLSLFSPSHRPSLLSSTLIGLIKDIHCSPPAIALQQQIRQSARSHTHTHTHTTRAVCCWETVSRRKWPERYRQKHRTGEEKKKVQAADLESTHTHAHRQTKSRMDLPLTHSARRGVRSLLRADIKHGAVMHTRGKQLSDLKYSANKRE